MCTRRHLSTDRSYKVIPHCVEQGSNPPTMQVQLFTIKPTMSSPTCPMQQFSNGNSTMLWPRTWADHILLLIWRAYRRYLGSKARHGIRYWASTTGVLRYKRMTAVQHRMADSLQPLGQYCSWPYFIPTVWSSKVKVSTRQLWFVQKYSSHLL